MNKHILHSKVQDFIQESYKKKVSHLLFKGSPFPEVTAQELATQIAGKQKAEKKLPTWFKNNKILYPPTINLEQTSSEITAQHKASIVSGNTLADLTGGFGIDTFFFSKKIEKVFHVEENENLSQLAAHNFSSLGAKNIQTITADSIEFIAHSAHYFDWLYIDPSRRDDLGGRIFFLQDCLPNVPENLDLLFRKADNILIKTSPLLDISAGISALKNVVEIQVIAVKNEVKEILWILKKKKSGFIKTTAINFLATQTEVFETRSEKNQENWNFSQPLSYLYEPNAAIMKMAAFKSLADAFDVKKLHQNSHLFTSEKKLETFPGRKFKVENVLPFNKKVLKRALNFPKANITTRNFPISVSNLRKQLKIQEGGNVYLFFTTDYLNKKIVLICTKYQDLKKP